MDRNVVDNQHGSVISVVLLILLLLTFMVAYGLMSSQTEMQVVRNDKIAKTTFYAAEAGIEVGRATLSRLLEADSGNWNNLLQGNPVSGGWGGKKTINEVVEEAIDPGAGDPTDRQVGPATFTLQVKDNNDFDDNSLVDNDYTIVLVSTGSWNNARSIIETEVHHKYGKDIAQDEGTAQSTGGGGGGISVEGTKLQ